MAAPPPLNLLGEIGLMVLTGELHLYATWKSFLKYWRAGSEGEKRQLANLKYKWNQNQYSWVASYTILKRE
jgi:hypothetical protein